MLEADAAVLPQELTVEAVEQLDWLEPCGTGNPRPVLVLTGAHVLSAAQVGRGRHLKLRLEARGVPLDAIFFSADGGELGLTAGCRVDVAFYPQINEFRGLRSVQLQVVDLRRAMTRAQLEQSIYEKYRRGERLTPVEAQSLLPTRAEFICLWRYLKRQSAGQPILRDTVPRIARRAARSGGQPELPTHTLVCLEVMEERGLLTLVQQSGQLEIILHQLEHKVDLNASAILKKTAEGHAGELGVRNEELTVLAPARSNSQFLIPNLSEGDRMDPILERYQALEDKVAAYTPNLDTKRLFDAFTYADTEHHGQLRKSGEPYIIHPLAVADIVADLGLDVDSVIAALLHDCIEDTDATHEEIAKKFGKSVAELVEGVTKLTRVQYVSKEEEQMENLRKMLMAMAHDIRVILIKICDRLHNMRTMEYQSPGSSGKISGDHGDLRTAGTPLRYAEAEMGTGGPLFALFGPRGIQGDRGGDVRPLRRP